MFYYYKIIILFLFGFHYYLYNILLLIKYRIINLISSCFLIKYHRIFNEINYFEDYNAGRVERPVSLFVIQYGVDSEL